MERYRKEKEVIGRERKGEIQNIGGREKKGKRVRIDCGEAK